jgi:hypothetical protein
VIIMGEKKTFMTLKAAKAEVARRWPFRKGVSTPLIDVRKYRNRERCVVGFTAIVSGARAEDHIIGYGDTWEEAFARADAFSRMADRTDAIDPK